MAITEFSEFVQNNLEEIHSTSSHKSFLGREFLTWLWFFAEQDNGEFMFHCPELGALKSQIWLDDRIVLTAKVGVSHDHIIKGGNPAQCQEAALALSHGKSVRELRLGMEVEKLGKFVFTLNGDDLCPKAVQLPDLRGDTDENPLEQRIKSLTGLGAAIDFLMSRFMGERVHKVWETEKLESIRKWIKTRAQLHDKLIH